jgi:uncharacterized membrane protein YadS
VALLAVLSAAAVALKADVKKFALAFTAVFAIAYASWIVGSYANFAAVTPAELQKFGISWSLRLTNEGGFVFALVAGLIIANVFPRFAETIKEAVRPELYIKIAIVILGGFFAVTAAGKLNLATSLLLRGVAAIIEAYLIYWAVVYFVARKWFGFNREWAAPLASGISICGVSAAIATGGAIRARPIVPGAGFLARGRVRRDRSLDPAVPGADVSVAGAAGRRRLDRTCRQNRRRGGRRRRHHRVFDSREVGGRRREISTRLDSRHHRHGESVHRHFHRHLGVRARLHLDQLCQRDLGQGENRRDLAALPKFILGFVLTFLIGLYLALATPADVAAKVPAAIGEANTFRVIFFILTFFSIGVLSNFKKLWQEGIGKLAAVYVISLFGFVIWVGLLISWLFFAGIKPPLAG